MDVKETIKKAESSPEFREFIQKNPDHYLVHAFSINDAQGFKGWEFGYYSKSSDKIAIFEFDDDKVTMHPESEVFKPEEKHVKALQLDKVNISYDDAMKIVESTLKENYREPLIRAIVLLQNIDEFSQIWNTTIITMAFNVINVKLDADSGKVLKHSKESLIGWNKE